MANEVERRSDGKATSKVAIIGTAPREAPEKVWGSGKPPGGKLPEKSK